MAVEQAQTSVRREGDHHYRRPRLSPDFNISLPEELFQNILSFLTVKEAARLSLLAPTYKKSALRSRKLHFDLEFCSRADFLPVVDRIFSLHEGPAIQSFRIHFSPRGVEEYVLRWIEKLVEKGVEEIDLNFLTSSLQFRLPSEFLNIVTIKILKLRFCELTIPPQLTGLRFLETLVLRKTANVTARSIETIFEHCTLLECLDLTECREILQLRILAMNHKNFKELRIGDCPDLAQIYVCARRLCSFHYLGGPAVCRFFLQLGSELKDVRFHLLSSKVIIPNFLMGGLLNDFVHTTEFTISGPFLECICGTIIKEGLISHQQPYLRHLKELQLIMRGARFIDTYDITCFINNCPRLEKLFIDLDDFSFECGMFYQLHHKELVEKYNQPFRNLKLIKISGFKYQDHEVELVKLLVRTTPSLEHLVLVTASGMHTSFCAPDVYYRDIIRCLYRASQFAQISIYMHSNDCSFLSPKHPKFWF